MSIASESKCINIHTSRPESLVVEAISLSWQSLKMLKDYANMHSGCPESGSLE